jgi:hypothetical protein
MMFVIAYEMIKHVYMIVKHMLFMNLCFSIIYTFVISYQSSKVGRGKGKLRKKIKKNKKNRKSMGKSEKSPRRTPKGEIKE